MSGLDTHQDKNEGTQPVPSFFDSAITGLSRLAARIAALLLIFMLMIIGYSVVQRYFFGTPVTWTDELTGYLVVAIVMLGAAETLLRDEHITVDLLTAGRHGMVKKAIHIWGNMAIIVVALTLMIGTWSSLSYSYNFDILSVGYLEVPMWIPQSSMMIGGVLLLLVALTRIINQMRRK